MIPARYRADFLEHQHLTLPYDRTFRGPVADHPKTLDTFLRFAARAYRFLAIAALELGFGAADARRYLAESARAWLEYAERVPAGISESDVEQALAACAACDRAACERFARAYLATPAGKGEPVEDRHWTYLAEAMARHYTGDAAGAAKAMAALAKLGPFKLGPSGAAWWKALEALAKECLLAKKPEPSRLLAAFAAETATQYGRAWRGDRVTDALFGDRALAQAAIARDRGWRVAMEDPDPTVPLELLRLAPLPVPERPLQEWPRPDPALLAAIAAAVPPPAAPRTPEAAATKATARKAAAKKAPTPKAAPKRKKTK